MEMEYNKNTAILLIIYIRSDATQKVFEQIKKIKPKRLYIAADGPKNTDEYIKCVDTRSIVSNIDWDCCVFKLYQEYNLGCDKHCYQAISWFFAQEEEGIILEDDCFPSLSFFSFCSYLLEYYRNDNRIGHISGSNFQFGNKRGSASYYFSNLTHVGGWAGWRRVWQEHQNRINDYEHFEKLGFLSYLPSHAPFRYHWGKLYRLANQGDNDICWDYKYAYSNLVNNRLSIIPNYNLICNIGCFDSPTHYIKDYPFANIKCEEIPQKEIIHPSFTCPDIEADLISQSKEYNISFDSYFVEKDNAYLKKMLENYSHGKSILIPKIIHQVYEDLAGPPSYLKEFASTWKEHNPDWEYRFWNKKDIDTLLEKKFSNIKEIYYSFSYPVQRWDIIRYLILYEYGGLYVDMDYECIEHITPLFNGITCAIGLEPKDHYIRSRVPYIIGNAFMASIPNHPFIKELLFSIFNSCDYDKYNSKYEEVLNTTGPYKVKRVYEKSKYKNQVTLIPPELVMPLSQDEVLQIINNKDTKYIENKIEKSYAIHYFLGSWF